MILPSIAQVVIRCLDNSGQTGPPVRLSSVVKLWGNVSVAFEDVAGEAFIVDLGRIGCQIIIRKGSSKERQRYSLAHELGHWVLLEHDIPLGQEGRGREIERWCNSFAAELLMPTKWIVADFGELRINGFQKAMHSLAIKYEVSNRAVAIRLTELTSVNYMRLLVSGDTDTIDSSVSKVTPLPIARYKDAVLRNIAGVVSPAGFYLEKGLYCHAMPLLISPKRKRWDVFLIPTNDGLTIASSGHE